MIHNKKICDLMDHEILNFIHTDVGDVCAQDLEKIRRYCGLHTWKLRNKIKSDQPEHGIAFLEKSQSLLGHYINQNATNWTSANCGAFMNSLCWINIALRQKLPLDLFPDHVDLDGRLCETEGVQDLQDLVDFFCHHPAENENHSVSIISPTDFNLFANLSYDLLKAINVKIDRVVVRKITKKRLFAELRRDGIRLILKKVFNKMVLRSDENIDGGSMSFRRIYRGRSRSLKRKCVADEVEYVEVSDFDEVPEADTLGVFCGGGLLSVDAINSFRKGVINTHMGILPKYRGMDVVEAAILNYDFSKIGLTCHFMDRGLDTGAILSMLRFDVRLIGNYQQLRNALGVLMPFFAVSTVIKFINGRIDPQPQDIHDGFQSYFLTKELYSLCDEIVRQLASECHQSRADYFSEKLRTLIDSML